MFSKKNNLQENEKKNSTKIKSITNFVKENRIGVQISQKGNIIGT